MLPGQETLICAGKNSYRFATQARSLWRGHLSRLQFIVPNSMSKKVGLTRDGRKSEHTLDAVGPLQWIVVEFDFSKTARDGITPTEWAPLIESWEGSNISIADACAALLYSLGESAPLGLVVHSGGKSLHGWFRVAGAGDGQLERFCSYAMRLG